MKYNKLYENWNRHLEEEFDPETGEEIDNRSPEQKAKATAAKARLAAMSPEEKAEYMKTRMPGQDKATENPAGDTRWADDDAESARQAAKSGEGKKLKAVAKELKVLLSKIMQELEE